MKYKYIFFLVVLLGLFTNVSAQKRKAAKNNQTTANNPVRQYSGTIKNSNGQPLQGVLVTVQEKNRSAVSDGEGGFAINASDNDILVFRKEGYSIFTMQPSASQLELAIELNTYEVDAGDDDNVVIPFGERKRREISTAITSFDGNKLPEIFATDIRNMFAGRIPGLMVNQTSTAPANESANMIIRSRSSYNSNEPLVLVDGIERAYADLDREEIESVTVLKDVASAVWYGLKAANGVIMITTKKGSKTRSGIKLDVQTTLQTPQHVAKPLSSYDFAKLYNEAIVNDGGSAVYSDDVIGYYQSQSNPFLYPNNNFAESFLNKRSFAQRYMVSADGGSNVVQYYFALGYINQDGLFLHSKNDQYNSNSRFRKFIFRTNLDFNVNKDFTISLKTGGRTENRFQPDAGTGNLLNAIYNTPPNLFPLRNQNGTYGGSSLYPNFINPLAELETSGFQSSLTRLIQTTLSGKYKLDVITKGLSANILFSYDAYGNYTSGMTGNYARYDFSNVTSTNPNPVIIGANTNLRYRADAYDANNRRNEIWAGLNYDRLFDEDHSVKSSLYGFRGIDYAPNRLDFRMQGAAYRAEYGFRSKYFLNFVASLSGSENFPPGKRYGFFPGASAAWVVTEGKFFPTNDILTYLKFRGSYAKAGNSDIGGSRFPFQTYFTRNLNGGGYPFGDGPTATNSAIETNIGNPNITWETIEGMNVGADVRFIKNRLELNIDFYKNSRYNILTPAALPGILGQSVAAVNEGKVESKGFDGAIYYRQHVRDFTIDINGNLSLFKNKILYQSGQLDLTEAQVTIGRPIGSTLIYLSNGLFQTEADIPAGLLQNGIRPAPGDIRYIDQNNDNVIDGMDRVRINANPNGFYGFGSSVIYKLFDLSFQFMGTIGRKVFIQDYYSTGPYSLNQESLKRWMPGSQDYTYPRLGLSNRNNSLLSDYWLREGDYLRLKTLEVGISLPKNLLNIKFVQGARLYFDGFNLLTIDKLNLNVDPEILTAGNVTYPYLKTYTLGLSVKF